MKRKLCILAPLAAVLIALSSWLLIEYLAQRPRFYEDAWSTAVSILKEEVGPKAVEKGIFAIPRDKIPLHDDIAVYASWYATYPPFAKPGNTLECVTVALCGRDSCIISDSSGLERPGDSDDIPSPTAAPLAASDARLAVAVALYLARATGPSCPSAGYRDIAMPDNGSFSSEVFDAAATSSAETPYVPLLYELRNRCIVRHIDSVRMAKAAAFARDKAGMRPFITKWLMRATPARDGFAAHLVYLANHALCDFPDASYLPLLEKLERRQVRHSRAAARAETRIGRYTLSTLPLVGGFFRVDTSSWSVADAIALCRAVKGLSREDYRKVIADAVRSDTLERITERGAQQSDDDLLVNYLTDHVRDEFSRAIEERWSSLSMKARYGCLDRFYVAERVLQCAARDTNPFIRATGKLGLFQATKDTAYLSGCLDELPAVAEVAVMSSDSVEEWGEFYENLAWMYMRSTPAPQVADAFAKEFRGVSFDASNPGAQWYDTSPAWFIAVLAHRGGRDAADAISALARVGDAIALTIPAPAENLPWSISYPPDGTMSRWLAESTDSAVADVFVRYLQSSAPGFKGAYCVAFAHALAARGDPRVLPFIEAMIPVEEGWHASEHFTSGYRENHASLLRQCISIVRFKTAPDPERFLLALKSDELTETEYWAAAFLARTYSQPQLKSLLASDSYAPLRAPLYTALNLRRDLDAKSAANK